MMQKLFDKLRIIKKEFFKENIMFYRNWYITHKMNFEIYLQSENIYFKFKNDDVNYYEYPCVIHTTDYNISYTDIDNNTYEKYNNFIDIIKQYHISIDDILQSLDEIINKFSTENYRLNNIFNKIFNLCSKIKNNINDNNTSYNYYTMINNYIIGIRIDGWSHLKFYISKDLNNIFEFASCDYISFENLEKHKTYEQEYIKEVIKFIFLRISYDDLNKFLDYAQYKGKYIKEF